MALHLKTLPKQKTENNKQITTKELKRLPTTTLLIMNGWLVGWLVLLLQQTNKQTNAHTLLNHFFCFKIEIPHHTLHQKSFIIYIHSTHLHGREHTHCSIPCRSLHVLLDSWFFHAYGGRVGHTHTLNTHSHIMFYIDIRMLGATHTWGGGGGVLSPCRVFS